MERLAESQQPAAANVAKVERSMGYNKSERTSPLAKLQKPLPGSKPIENKKNELEVL